MKLTIKTQSGQKVVDLNSDLQFNTIKGEQYVFSNGFSNYVLNFKDNQESVTLTFNVNGKSIKVELNGIVPLLQANTTNMPNPTAIIINKDLNEKDVDSIVENNSFDGGEIIDRLEALLSKPVELGDNVSSNLTLITNYQTLLESLGAAAAGAEAGGNATGNGSTFNSIFSINDRGLNDIADTARWENLSESIANIPVDTADNTGDRITIFTSMTSSDVNENADSVTFNIFLSYVPQGTANTVTVNVTDQNGNVTTYIVDINADGRGVLTIKTQDMDVYNDSQSLTAEIVAINGGDYEEVVFGTPVTVNITDIGAIDDVTLILDDVNVNEGTGTATVGGSLDYAPQTTLVVTLSNGSTITFGPDYVVGTIVQSTPFVIQGDDVYKDGETYTVTVVSTTGGNFENLVTTDTAKATVTDTETPVTVNLSASTVNEDAANTSYVFTATLSAASQGDTIIVTDKGTITIADGQTTGTLTIASNNTSDVYVDRSELTATITSASGGNFEKINVGTATAKATVTDTTDTVIIKIFVSDENGMPLKDINGNYLTTNSVTEGAKAHYVALAFEPNTTEFNDNTVVSDQVGTVDFKFTPDTATVNTATNASAGSNDYLPQSTLTNIALGKAISMDALDDYISDNGEVLNISIENYKAPNSGKIYEDVILNSDKVVTTILDDTIFGQEDTVYVKIENNASVIEGNALTHTITLVDKFGNPVVVPAGQSIKITLTYSSDTTENEDFNSTTTYKTTEVVITGGNSSVIVKNSTVDDFTNEGKEGYVLKITDVEQSSHYYENVEVHAGKNSVTGEIIDGVSIETPINGTVDEDNFIVTNSNTSISTTGNLGITAPSGDNGYTLSFTTTPTNSLGEPLTSDGKKITYILNGNTITAIREGDNKTVFEIKLNKNSAGGSDDSYTYTQYENIDHPIKGIVGINSSIDQIIDDNIVLNFGFKITDQGKTSPLVEFKVTVNDSLPNAINKTFELNEDTSINITLTEESFSSLLIWNKGLLPETLDSSNPTVDIFDPNNSNIVIGKLTYNGSGYVTFTPNPDYSNYNATPSFKYGIQDSDGDIAFGEIKFKVNPVADGLTWNYTNVTTNEDVNVDMNLTLPTIIDNSDDNGNKTGDHGERIGVIELSSIDKGAIIYNGNIALNSGTTTATLKFVIVNADGSLDTSLHYSNIDMNDTSIIHLTKAQYENLTITPISQSHNDITMTLKATSYEVDDSGNPLSGVAGKTTSKDITVVVKSVTDDISLSFDNKNNPDDNISSDSKTYTIASKLEEGNNVIDLQAILTPTSGNSLDLDGSEQRSYTVSGVPEGTIITLGGVSAVANSSGIAIVNFDATAEKIVDPTFTMTLPGEFSGKIDATITLKVTDIDDHAGSAVPETKTQTVYLKMNVDPVADQVTLSVSQAKGYEDAGRSKGNTSNDENADDINAKVGNKIPGAIDLDINVKSDDIDGSETFTVVISDIPTGASIYYNGIEVVQNPAGKITIENFNNTIPLQIVPTHNSDEDFNLKVKAYSVDTATNSTGTVTTVTSEAIAQELTLNVQIKGVADVPVNEIFKELDSTGSAVENGIYQAVVSEDMGNTENGATINFADIYKNSGLSSYDDSEDLSVVITGVKGNFDIEGAVFLGGEGESRTWLFDAKNVANIKILTEKNYSGEIDFKIRYVTTEKEGDSKTLSYENVKILVTPDVDATINTSTSVKEDTLTKVNFSISTSDSNESLVQVRILALDVDGKDFTLYLGNNTTPISSLSKDADGYYVLNAQEAKNLYVQYKSDLGSSQDTKFDFKYTIKDSITLSDSNVISDIEEKDSTYNLTLTAVTDEISINANVGLSPIIDISNQNGEGVKTVTIKETGSFDVDIALNAVASDNADRDTDGSEAVTRLVVEGVPLGMSIENGTFTVTSNGTNLWFIDIPDTKLDGSYTLKFNVHNTLSNETGEKYNIKITAYNQDGENSQVTTATTELKFVDAIANTSGGSGLGVNSEFFIEDFNVTEDKAFSLADIVTIIADTNRTDEAYSISFKGLENLSISADSLSKLVTYEENGETVYVLNIGSSDNIETALQSIVFLPEANFNENNDKGEKVSIQPTLTTYVIGTSLVSVITPAGGFNDENVTPVTDAIASSDLISTINEDQTYTFDIKPKTVDDLDSNGNFSNDGANADGSDYEILGDITLTHSGVNGILELSDGTKIIFDGTTTSAIISPSQLIGLKFTPDTYASGTAKFTYSLETQENGATNTKVGGGIIAINITPIVNGLELEGLKAIGSEYTDGINEFIALTTDNGGIGLSNMIDSDGSETIQTILLDGIPAGFLVYYGEEGSQKLAQNAGNNNSSPDIVYNTWNIPVESNGTAPQIWVKAPENWSGDVSGITLKTIVKDGETISTITKDFTLNVSPVASSVTISPTTTFANAYNWTEINLNANMTDLDGSETLTIELTGETKVLDGTALFRLSDGTLFNGLNGNPSATFDILTSTWKLEGIPSSQINNIEILYHNYEGKVDVSIITVDGEDILDTPASGSFDMNIANSNVINLSNETADLTVMGTSTTTSIKTGSGDDIISVANLNATVDAGDGKDTLVLDNNDTIDLANITSKVKNIEVIDLENSSNQTLKLDLNEVIDITDNNNELIIKGNLGDSIHLDTPSDWTNNGIESYEGINYNVYKGTGTNSTVKLLIDEDITVSDI
ncbi:immunoglobulin-like domain-containing protein [Arcobacter suis]|uniref:immunoglobulin-like domain-containing protein n=1 Tax=Arcobacter suis TaxID=1278212 RepID=UPI0039F11F5D